MSTRALQGAAHGGRVAHRELVAQRVGVDARDPLDQVQVGARPSERGLAQEVRGNDDERVALPAPARVADPLPEPVRQGCASVEGDDAGVVHHLVEDDDVVGGLEELHVVVVDARRHRRTRVEPEEAALGYPAVLRAVCVTPAEEARQLAAGRGVRPHGRDAPVGRVDDQRGALPLERVALLEPDGLLVADARLERRGGRRRVAGPAALGQGLLPLRRFLGAEGLAPGEIVRPLHGGGGGEVPKTLEVRVSVRRAERRLRRRRRRERRAGERDQHHGSQRRAQPIGHRTLHSCVPAPRVSSRYDATDCRT